MSNQRNLQTQTTTKTKLSSSTTGTRLSRMERSMAKKITIHVLTFVFGFALCAMLQLNSGLLHQEPLLENQLNSLRPPSSIETKPETPKSTSSSKPKSTKPKAKKHFDFPTGLTLPDKIYQVMGLESSGTNMIADILSKVHETGGYRHTQFNMKENRKIWVQHISLPTGKGCEETPIPQLQKVLPPGQCKIGGNQFLNKTVQPRFKDVCIKIGADAKIPMNDGTPIYAKRMFVDIVGNKEWWESLGVEVVTIVLVRDQNIARIGRRKHDYCNDEALLMNEERFGRDVIARAINKYILEEDDDEEIETGINKRRRRRLTESMYQEWYEETFWTDPISNGESSNATTTISTTTELRGQRRRRLSAPAAALPSGNNVFIMSMETLLHLKEVYIKMFYKALGIESDYMPLICDSNERYVNGYNGTAKASWELRTGGNKIVDHC